MSPEEKRASIIRLREAVGQIIVGGARPPKFTKAQRNAVLEKCRGECDGCGDELRPGWHIDHIKEWADGGAHELANWRALCVPCHLRKTGAKNSERAKPNRIRKREHEGPKPATLKSRSEWPKGQKLQSRARPWGYQAREGR